MTLTKGDYLLKIQHGTSLPADAEVYVLETAAPTRAAFRYGPIASDPADTFDMRARLVPAADRQNGAVRLEAP